MALSKSVEESLIEAESSLRNALAFAARQERPAVCADISRMLNQIEGLRQIDGIMDKLENRTPGDKGNWGPLIDFE